MVVLARYDEEAVMPAVKLLSDPAVPDGWERIKLLFSSVVGSVRHGDRRGCLLCSAAAGPAADDADIAKAVHRSLDKMRKGFETAMVSSSAHEHLDQGMKRSFADTLTTQYVGLRVLVRSHASLATIERSAKGIREILNPQS